MSQHLKQVVSCELCGGTNLSQVLDLGNHPLCDDLIPIDSTVSCKEYPIQILFCPQCSTAHQRFQVTKKILFPTSYHYRSRFTADVLNGMHSLVEDCDHRFGPLQSKLILDIGCNDGSLLNFFAERGAKTIGIEPTAASIDAKLAGHVVYDDYLSPDLANTIISKHGHPDFITFTNVFAHIDDLNSVLLSLSRLMCDTTIVVIENHYLGSIIDGNQFDTFYHEHPRTYTLTSFTHVISKLESRLLTFDFPARYGGNIRIAFSRCSLFDYLNKSSYKDILVRESLFAHDFTQMTSNIEEWKVSKRAEILSYVDHSGPLRAKAFPGRAAILIKLLNLDESIVSAVYEKPGSPKIGHFVPGTRIQIRSDSELFAFADQDMPIINFAWHISNEIRSYLSKNLYTGFVIDIL